MAAVIAAAAITLPGCSAAQAPSPAPGVSGGAVDYQAPSAHRLDAQKLARIVQELPPSSPQRSLLRDGTVSRADLDLSWTRLRSCIEAGGLTVKGPIVNPITSTEYLYTYKRQGGASLPTTTAPTTTAPTTTAPTTTTSTTEEGGGADDAIVKGCEEKFWIPLSSVYSANTPQHMNSRLAGFMTECMTRAHYPAAGAATFDQIVRDASGTVTTARLREANDCLDRGVLALFPDLPYFPRP